MTDTTRRAFVQGAALAAGAHFVSGRARAAAPAAAVAGAPGAKRDRKADRKADRIRLGIIGAGGRGKELMKGFLAAGAEFVAVADVFRGRHDEAKALVPGIRAYDDHRKLLDQKDVDAVVIASPLHCHARHFLDGLDAGKDLYVEKTLTWSIAEAEACRRAAEKHAGRVVSVGLQNQSAPSLAAARKWVTDGLVGKVTEVDAWMSRNTPRGQGQWVRPIPAGCSADTVNWGAFLCGRRLRAFDAQRFINWRLFWEFSGGNVTENMVHQVAWLMAVLDLPLPDAAYTAGGVFSEKDGREVPDTIAVTLEFPEMVLSWRSTFSNARYGFGDRILGSHGTIERQAGATDMVTGKSVQSLTYTPERANRAEGAALEAPAKGEGGAHPANFLDCVRSRKATNAPVEIGYRSAIAAHLANIACRRRQRVTLDEARRIASHGLGGEGGPVNLYL